MGSKGAGKSQLLNNLSVENLYYTEDLMTIDCPGSLADYRAELSLAVSRATFFGWEEGKGIFESSLIDSVAYSALRYSFILNDGTGDENDLLRWMLTMHTSALMLRDTFTADAVIYVPGNDGEYFNQELESALAEVIYEVLPKDIPIFVLQEIGLQRVKELDTILQGLDESGTTNKESPGES